MFLFTSTLAPGASLLHSWLCLIVSNLWLCIHLSLRLSMCLSDPEIQILPSFSWDICPCIVFLSCFCDCQCLPSYASSSPSFCGSFVFVYACNSTQCAIIWAKDIKHSHANNAVCNSGASAFDLSTPSRRRAEQQKLKHELLLLRRRQQVEASALRAQHDAKVAAAKAAWEAERRKLVYKNQTLQATVDQSVLMLSGLSAASQLFGCLFGNTIRAALMLNQQKFSVFNLLPALPDSYFAVILQRSSSVATLTVVCTFVGAALTQ